METQKELDGNPELARPVDVLMAREDDLHFDDQSKQVVSLFFVAVFSKRNRKHVLCASIEL